MVMKKYSDRAIRLESSHETLFFPDGSMDNGVLIGLLQDAYERKIPKTRKVLITEKTRNLRLRKWGYEGAYCFPQVKIPLFRLYSLWTTLPGSGNQEFTPENENQRLYWEGEISRRRAEWGPAIQQFMRAGAIEAMTGVPQGALMPLRQREAI